MVVTKKVFKHFYRGEIVRIEDMGICFMAHHHIGDSLLHCCGLDYKDVVSNIETAINNYHDLCDYDFIPTRGLVIYVCGSCFDNCGHDHDMRNES